MKFKNFLIIILVLIVIPSKVTYAEQNPESRENNDNNYLLSVGVPLSDIENMSTNNKSTMVDYLKSLDEEYTYSGKENKFTKVAESNSKISMYSKSALGSSIDTDELELGVYYFSSTNNFNRHIIFPYFKWLDCNKFMPHIIKNDSFSYCIDANSWKIVTPKNSKASASSCTVNYIFEGKTMSKKYNRPTTQTWTGATYKMDYYLYGNDGMATFSITPKSNGSRDPRIIIDYIDDTSKFNNSSYTVEVDDILSISVTGNTDSCRQTSTMLNMFTQRKS